jgi:hypothetical protein
MQRLEVSGEVRHIYIYIYIHIYIVIRRQRDMTARGKETEFKLRTYQLCDNRSVSAVITLRLLL